jgi:hypothetical protein
MTELNEDTPGDVFDYFVELEMPSGAKIIIEVPKELPSYWKRSYEDGDRFGLNLVTNGHYT